MARRHPCAFPGFAILALHAAGVAAQTGAPELEFFAEQPIVLSASRLEQPLARTPAAVTVIDRDMIVASGARHIPEVLRYVPGFQVVFSRGDFQTATYYGLSSIFARRMQVQVDGRSIYNPAYGHVIWRDLPLALEDVERIEVVRGPNASIDGTNAVQASINVITRPAGEDPGWTAKTNLGDFGVQDLLARYSGSAGPVKLRLTALDRRDDWYRNLPDDAHDSMVNLRAEYWAGAHDEITFAAGYTRGRWEEGSFGSLATPPHDSLSKSGFAQARWRHVFDADNEWTLHAHHSRNTLTDEWLLARVVPVNQSYKMQRDALEFSAANRPLAALRVSWGAEARSDEATSLAFTGTARAHRGWLYRLFAHGEWRIAQPLTLHAGAMVEDHYYAGRRTSPRVALNYEPAPRHSLRLGVSRAYRTPTFLEQTADQRIIGGGLNDQLLLARVDLRPEVMLTQEIGYLYAAPRGVQLDVRLFRNRIRDVIDVIELPSRAGEVPRNGFESWVNGSRVRQRGLEYQLRWQPRPATWLSFAQAWARTDSNNPEIVDSVPSLTYSLLASHAFGAGWSGSLGWHRVGTMTWIGAGVPVPAHQRVDLRLARQWRSGPTTLEWALVGQALNGSYLEYPGSAGSERIFERRWYTSVKLAW